MVIESDSPLSGYGGEMAGVVGAEVEGLWLSSLYSETFHEELGQWCAEAGLTGLRAGCMHRVPALPSETQEYC